MGVLHCLAVPDQLGNVWNPFNARKGENQFVGPSAHFLEGFFPPEQPDPVKR